MDTDGQIRENINFSVAVEEDLTYYHVPIDGYIHFWKHGKRIASFPFRDENKTDFDWFGNSNGDKWEKKPIWKWENPEDGTENITLSPSLAISKDGTESGMVFHCYVENGGVDWL